MFDFWLSRGVFFMIFIYLSIFDCHLVYFSWFSSIYRFLTVIWYLFHDFHRFIDIWFEISKIENSIFSKSQNLKIFFQNLKNLKISKYFIKISKSDFFFEMSNLKIFSKLKKKILSWKKQTNLSWKKKKKLDQLFFDFHFQNIFNQDFEENIIWDFLRLQIQHLWFGVRKYL